MECDYDVVIVGGGPAGLAAALYLGRAKVKTLVIDKDICGGQINSSPLLENMPGFYGSGLSFIDHLFDEIKSPPVEFLYMNAVTKVKKEKEEEEGFYYLTYLEDGRAFTSKYVIFATGASPIKLPFETKNTHYCVTCDGALYQDRVVAVVGGGNSALQYALELTKYARKVFICTNWHHLTGESTLLERVYENEKITTLCNFTALSFDENVLKSSEGQSLEVDGVFVAIGNKVDTSYFDEIKQGGKFITDDHLRVRYSNYHSHSNLFAIGDCRAKPFNQVAIAVSDGCIAALTIIKDLEK